MIWALIIFGLLYLGFIAGLFVWMLRRINKKSEDA